MARHHRTTHIMSNSYADELFALGRILHLSLTINRVIIECKASLLKPFLPFTKARSYLSSYSLISGIPSNVVLKIYDPHFINDRDRISDHIPNRPWSLSLDVKPLLATMVSMITTRIIGSTLASCSGKKISAGTLKSGLTLS